MLAFRSRFNYDSQNPLRKPSNEAGIYNANFKGYDSQQERTVLITEYSCTKPQQVSNLKRIIEKIQPIKHENLSEIYEIATDQQGKNILLALQFCEGGSILEYVQKQSTNLDYRLALRIISEVMEGLSCLHLNNIIHRLINLENIQIDSLGTPKLTVKCLIFKSVYLSPEEKQNSKKHSSSDIFSLGIALYRMIYGLTPFRGKSVEEFTKSVQAGPDFVSRNQGYFPIVAPKHIKDIIKLMTNVNPDNRRLAVAQLKDYQNLRNIDILLPSKVYQRITDYKYICVLKNYDSPQQTNITVLNSKSKTIEKIHTFKAELVAINDYFNSVLSPFIEFNNPALMKVIEHQIIGNSFLVLITSYDNQGSLKDYKESIELFAEDRIFSMISNLKNLFNVWGNQYNYLTNRNIVLHQGKPLLRIPPFPTFQFREVLKDLKKGQKISFIAPEIIQGNGSFNADSWSIGVLQYWMKFGQMPEFDMHGTLIIPHRKELTADEIRTFSELIQVDPKRRKNIFKPKLVLDFDQLSQEEIGHQRKQSEIVEHIGRRNKNQSEMKMKSPKKLNSALEISYNKQLLHSQGKMGTNRTKKTDNQNNLSEENNIMIGSKIDRDANKKSNKKHQDAKEPIQNQQKCLDMFARVFKDLSLLQRSWSKPIRILIKCILGIVLYLFLFYYSFFQINGNLIGERFSYQATTVKLRAFTSDTVPDIDYTLVTKNPVETNTTLYNTTLANVRDSFACVLNTYSTNSNVVNVLNLPGFTVYQVFGVLLAIINLLIICLVLSRLDFPKVFSITRFQDNVLTPIYHFILVQMSLASLTSCTYLIYGGLFHLQTDTCMRKPLLPALQYLFKNWVDSFAYRFSGIYLGIVLCYVIIIYFIIRPAQKLHIVAYIVLICLYLTGVGTRAMGGYVPNSIQSILGVCGELLVLITGIVFFVVDAVFICFIAKGSKTERKNRTKEEMNKTQEYIFERSADGQE